MNLEPNALKISVLEVGALLKNNDDATDLPVVCMSKKTHGVQWATIANKKMLHVTLVGHAKRFEAQLI